MAAHESFERRLFVAARERLQKLSVRQVCPICPQRGAAKTLDNPIHPACHHPSPQKTPVASTKGNTH
jgi:hypothetical protein